MSIWRFGDMHWVRYRWIQMLTDQGESALCVLFIWLWWDMHWSLRSVNSDADSSGHIRSLCALSVKVGDMIWNHRSANTDADRPGRTRSLYAFYMSMPGARCGVLNRPTRMLTVQGASALCVLSIWQCWDMIWSLETSDFSMCNENDCLVNILFTKPVYFQISKENYGFVNTIFTKPTCGDIWV